MIKIIEKFEKLLLATAINTKLPLFQHKILTNVISDFENFNFHYVLLEVR